MGSYKQEGQELQTRSPMAMGDQHCPEGGSSPHHSPQEPPPRVNVGLLQEISGEGAERSPESCPEAYGNSLCLPSLHHFMPANLPFPTCQRAVTGLCLGVMRMK